VEGNTIGPDESDKKGSDGAFGEPLSERVEEKLGASIGVFLPSIKLLVSYEASACPIMYSPHHRR
jgi:hypothetical protein